MEQQTITGSGLYILIAVQLLFSMLILLRIRQYRKKPDRLPAVRSRHPLHSSLHLCAVLHMANRV